jgi:hypothetical protein
VLLQPAICSISRRGAAFSRASNAERLSRPLARLMPLVFVALHNCVAGAFGPGLQLLALAHGALRVGADTDVDGDVLGLGGTVQRLKLETVTSAGSDALPTKSPKVNAQERSGGRSRVLSALCV